MKLKVNSTVGIPVFNVDKYLVHNDCPTVDDLSLVSRSEQMMISFVKLPSWMTIFNLEKELSDMLLEKFLHGRLLNRSYHHAVFFCDHNEDTELLFSIYKEEVRKSLSKPSNELTTLNGDNDVSKL